MDKDAYIPPRNSVKDMVSIITAFKEGPDDKPVDGNSIGNRINGTYGYVEVPVELKYSHTPNYQYLNYQPALSIFNGGSANALRGPYTNSTVRFNSAFYNSSAPGITEGTEIEFSKFVMLVDNGLEYIPGTTKLNIQKGMDGYGFENILKSNVNPDGELTIDPSRIIKNYKGSGKTAVIWDLNRVTVTNGGIAPSSNIFNIVADFKMTIDTKPDENALTSYLLWNNNFSSPDVTDQVKTIGNSAAADKLDYDGDGDITELGLIDKRTVRHLPAKELQLLKRTQGSIDDEYTDNKSETELTTAFKYQIYIYNYTDNPVNDITFLDVLPHPGDKLIVDKIPRGSIFETPLEDPVKADKFNVFYTEDELNGEKFKGNAEEFLADATWVDSLDDYSKAKAFKLILKTGESIPKGEITGIEFYSKMIHDESIPEDAKAINSVAFTFNGKKFSEAPSTSVLFATYKFVGKVFMDTNKNNIIDPGEEGIANVLIELLHEDGTPVVNSEGKPITTMSEADGSYFIRTYTSGKYKVRMTKPNAMDVMSENVGGDNGSGVSQDNNDSSVVYSESIDLTKAHKKTIVNAGIIKRFKDIKVNLEWIGGPDTKPDSTIKLYRTVEGKEPELVSTDTITSGNLKHIYKGLPETDEFGNEYTYSITQDKIENYATDISGVDDDKGFLIKNTYIPPTDDVVATVTWIGGPSQRPTVVIHLKQTINGVESDVVDKDGNPLTITLTSGNLIANFGLLPKTDENGNIITYSVLEPGADGYTVSYNGLDITNTYINPVTPPPVDEPDKPPTPPVVEPEKPVITPPITPPIDIVLGGWDRADDIMPLREEKYHFRYVQGYEDTTFKPDGDITRAEVAMIFARLSVSGMEIPTDQVPNYTDVKPGFWYSEAIGYMSSKGILKGYPDGSFMPDAKITRAELAAIVTRFNTEIGSGTAINFSDVLSSHWAAENISKASINGWVTGYPDGSFKPNQAITRAETVTTVNRMAERYADKEFVNEKPILLKSYTDISKHWAFYEIHEASNSHYYNRNVDNSETWNRVVDR